MKHKTEIKKAFDSEHTLKFVASNKDYTAEWDFKPSDLNKDGMTTTVEVEAKCIPAKAAWEGKAEFKIGGFGAGPLTSFTELQFDSNNKQDHKVTFSQNVVCEKKYHTAVKVVASAGKKQELTDAQAIIAANMSFGDLWLRGNLMKKFWGVGATFKDGNDKHAVEMQYDLGNPKNEGLFGMPLFFRSGNCFALGNQKLSTFSYFGKQWWIKNKYEIPVDDKFKVTFSDKLDMLEFFKMSKSCQYTWGMAVEMKL